MSVSVKVSSSPNSSFEKSNVYCSLCISVLPGYPSSNGIWKVQLCWWPLHWWLSKVNLFWHLRILMTVRKSLLFGNLASPWLIVPAAPWDNPRPPSELILRGGAIKEGVKYWKSILVIFLSFPSTVYFPSGKSWSKQWGKRTLGHSLTQMQLWNPSIIDD